MLGLNGAGKTTLLPLLAGLRRPTPAGWRRRRALGSRPSPSHRPARPVDRPGHGAAHLRRRDHAWASDSAVRGVLDGLGLPDIGLDTVGGEPVRRRTSPGRAGRRAGHRRRSADPRRADQPPGHRRCRLAGRPPARPARRRSSWSPTTAGSSTRWPPPPGRSWTARCTIREGGYSDWVFARAERLRLDRRPRRSAEATWRARNSPGCAAARRPGRPSRDTGSRPRRRSSPTSRRRGTRSELHALRPPAARQGRARPGGRHRDAAPTVPRPLLDHVTWLVGPGDRIGLVGSTAPGSRPCCGCWPGCTVPDAGRVKRGKTVRVGYLSQESRAGRPTCGCSKR